MLVPRLSRITMLAGMLLLAAACLPQDLLVLASDDLEGRATNSPGGVASRNYLIDQLEGFAEPIKPELSGRAGYTQVFPDGVNVMAVIPGTDLADEYVVVGAHYDGTGDLCESAGDDTICNGATDNATGVAIVVDIGRRLAEADVPPRRSVVLAFWDAEEIGLLGSSYFIDNPLVPLGQIYSYVNYDIQGSNLSPSLRDTTFAVAAESGGATLGAHLETATADSPLKTRRLSSLFGLLRSDYAPFLAASVPTVFFTDSTGPCYETVDDELEVVDLGKVLAQAEIGLRLVDELSSSDQAVDYVGGFSAARFDDAVTMAAVLDSATRDLDLFSSAGQRLLLNFKATVDAMVADGPDAFGVADIANLLNGSAGVIALVSSLDCDGYLTESYVPARQGR